MAAALMVFSCAPAAVAHHSAAVYDMGAVVVLRGTVLRYDWKNPHVYIVIAAETPGGATAEWAIEGESTALMTRSGWTATTLAPGERVLARANANRRPERREARLITLTADDGTVLVRKASGPAPTVAATGLAGVWDAIRGYDDFRFVRGALTPRGAAIVSDFDEGQSPVKDCLAFPVPIVTILPYRTRLEVEPDRILLHSEYFDVERVIYVDGRGHPQSGERTPQGHSIGRWDGDALVVETALFSDHPLGNWRGLPSGAQKRVVERFEPTPDRTRLRVSFRVEDPEYLVDPWIGQVVWDFVADGEILPYRCDREIARRFARE
jgi:hypothetical protein